MLGFIFTRHIIDNKTNEYWKENIKCIRQFYKNDIIIIDDKSNDNFVENFAKDDSITIIKSDFPGVGELLPYYYLYINKYFDKAIIIHDSTFIQKDIGKTEGINFLWNFSHKWDNDKKTINIIEKSNMNYKDEIIHYYKQKELWTGCFGLQTVIEYNFVVLLQGKFNIFSLIRVIKNRQDRCCIERIFGVLCFMLERNVKIIYGVIHDYLPWGYTFEKYKDNKIKNKDVIKVWTGR